MSSLPTRAETFEKSFKIKISVQNTVNLRNFLYFCTQIIEI